MLPGLAGNGVYVGHSGQGYVGPQRLRAEKPPPGEDAKTEARRSIDRHGLKGVRLDSAVLQEAQGTVLWVTHGATEAGESIAVHLEPLTGKLIAFHVGGER